jgi:hypothetical protein
MDNGLARAPVAEVAAALLEESVLTGRDVALICDGIEQYGWD